MEFVGFYVLFQSYFSKQAAQQLNQSQSEEGTESLNLAASLPQRLLHSAWRLAVSSRRPSASAVDSRQAAPALQL